MNDSNSHLIKLSELNKEINKFDQVLGSNQQHLSNNDLKVYDRVVAVRDDAVFQLLQHMPYRQITKVSGGRFGGVVAIQDLVFYPQDHCENRGEGLAG